jgi:23S rRNA (uracil1939-C5)-methyltransferase
MRLVVEATAKAKKVADLFSGIGTFALPVARTARVLAVDGDKAAVQALAHAHRHEPGLKPIEAKVRDLYREPLSAKELEPFDAIVLDPPHAGARSQAEAIAGSRARTVVAVSCNPATLARDLRSLVDGGYGIERITPIDQFVYSADVEVIAVLHRGSR